MKRHLLIGIAVIVICGFGASNLTAAAASNSTLQISGKNLFQLSSPSVSVEVYLPKNVVLPSSCYSESAFRVLDKDASVIAQFVPDGYSFASTGTPLQFGRLRSGSIDRIFSNRCGERNFSKGRYHLTIASTKPNVTVSFDLPGLSGSRRIVLGQKSDAQVLLLPSLSPYAAASPAVASFAGAGHLARQGTIGAAIVLRHAATAPVVVLGECDVKGKQTLPLFLSHAPGCPIGGGAQSLTSGRAGGVTFQVSSTHFVQPNDYTVGTYYVEAGLVADAASLAFWLPFR